MRGSAWLPEMIAACRRTTTAATRLPNIKLRFVDGTPHNYEDSCREVDAIQMLDDIPAEKLAGLVYLSLKSGWPAISFGTS